MIESSQARPPADLRGPTSSPVSPPVGNGVSTPVGPTVGSKGIVAMIVGVGVEADSGGTVGKKSPTLTMGVGADVLIVGELTGNGVTTGVGGRDPP